LLVDVSVVDAPRVVVSLIPGTQQWARKGLRELIDGWRIHQTVPPRKRICRARYYGQIAVSAIGVPR
jgi:hypothetical protein